MADVRGLNVNPVGFLAAVANTPAPAGFTGGQAYPVVSLAADSTPVPPVAYILTVDNTGVLKAVAASSFTFTYERVLL